MSLVVGTNSYTDVATANDYFKDAIHAASWASATNGVRSQALVTATRQLDRQPWLGTKAQPAPTQVLDWPRSGLTDDEGEPISDASIPAFIVQATSELALQLIINTELQDQQNTGSNVKRLKAGSAEIEYFATGTSGSRFPTIVQELIGRYLEGSTFSGPLASGIDGVTGLPDYGRSEGLY